MRSNAAVMDAPEVAEFEPERKRKPKKQPPYNVIVYNDDQHTYEYVIKTLEKVFGYPPEKGFQLADQIHRIGQAVVWTGTRELAELKVDQIKGAGKDFYAKEPVDWPLRCECVPAY